MANKEVILKAMVDTDQSVDGIKAFGIFMEISAL